MEVRRQQDPMPRGGGSFPWDQRFESNKGGSARLERKRALDPRMVVTGARRKAGSGAKGGYAEPPFSFSDESHKEASFIDFKSSSSSCLKYELDTYCCEDVATLPQRRCTVAPSDPTRTSLKINRKQ